MTYIGQQPATTFDAGIQDRFTGLSTNTVTLTHEIAAEEDILVVWNNIVQDKNTYSVGGTGNKTLTLGGTLVSADVVTVYYLNKVMQSVNPTAGSVGTEQLNTDAVTEAKIADDAVESEHLNNNIISGQTELAETPADTDELLVSDAGVLKRVDYSYLKSENKPYWFGRKTNLSDQYLTRATKTKVTSMSDDEADSHSAYSSDRFTVPSGHGGIYLVTGCILGVASNAGNDGEEFNVFVYKNGVEKRTSGFVFDTGGKFQIVYQNVVGLIELAAGDYVELYAELSDDDNSNTMHINGGVGTHFGGFKIA